MIHQVDTPYDGARDRGTLVLVVRQDADTPTDEAIAEGNFAPLTIDSAGYLRVQVPAAGVPLAEARSLEERLDETNSYLRRLVLAMETILGHHVPDPV